MTVLEAIKDLYTADDETYNIMFNEIRNWLNSKHIDYVSITADTSFTIKLSIKCKQEEIKAKSQQIYLQFSEHPLVDYLCYDSGVIGFDVYFILIAKLAKHMQVKHISLTAAIYMLKNHSAFENHDLLSAFASKHNVKFGNYDNKYTVIKIPVIDYLEPDIDKFFADLRDWIDDKSKIIYPSDELTGAIADKVYFDYDNKSIVLDMR